MKDVVIQLDAPENETMEGRERGTSTIKIFPKAEYEASQRERAASAAAGKKAEELTRSKSKFSAATKTALRRLRFTLATRTSCSNSWMPAKTQPTIC